MKMVRKTKHHHGQPGRKPGNGAMIWIIVIVVLTGVPFGLGKYIEFNSPGPFDSASNVYSAKRILDGARIGIEEKPSAATGTLLVNMLGVRLFGFNEAGPKLIQGILQAAALIVMFLAMRKLFGTPAAVVGVIVASVYLSAPLIAKFGNVKEQYMIAFMILGVGCFVLGRYDGRWWLTLLAGGFLSWGPLFKETGFSAIAAVGLFIVVQAFLKKQIWKRAVGDMGLLVAGAVIAIAPLYVWILTSEHRQRLPYSIVWKPITSVFAASEGNRGNKPRTSEERNELPGVQPDEDMTSNEPFGFAQDRPEREDKLPGGYVIESWRILEPKERREVARRIVRYYRLLILPIALAAGAIVARLIRLFRNRAGKLKVESKESYERFVLLFAVWWLLDMAFVWVSPRSYEQYYLPLNASAAMLGGYLVAIYHDKVRTAVDKPRWVVIGLVSVLLMIIMSWHIFFGIETSPHSGTRYGGKRRGYAQKLSEISQRKGKKLRGAWEVVGDYIRAHSTPDDKIYVWGWVPGIYVRAQRLSPAPKAFEGTMHTISPEELAKRVNEILASFKGQRLRFIVDTRKLHYPWNRPPLELWPRTPKGFLPPSKQIVEQFDSMYFKMLQDNYEPDEALRYKAMQPFREFVMNNYKIVGQFGDHILFERK